MGSGNLHRLCLCFGLSYFGAYVIDFRPKFAFQSATSKVIRLAIQRLSQIHIMFGLCLLRPIFKSASSTHHRKAAFLIDQTFS